MSEKTKEAIRAKVGDTVTFAIGGLGITGVVVEPRPDPEIARLTAEVERLKALNPDGVQVVPPRKEPAMSEETKEAIRRAEDRVAAAAWTASSEFYDRLNAFASAIRADEREKVLEEVHSRTMTRAILPDLTPDGEASDD